jgi:hypothetical protein
LLIQTFQKGEDQTKTISRFRQKIARRLDQHPGLRAHLTNECIQATYERGVFDVHCALDVPKNEFPPTCPYSVRDLLPDWEELTDDSGCVGGGDPHAWAVQTGKQLRARSIPNVDWMRVQEILHSIIRSERRQLLVPMALRISYLLRWDFQHIHDSLSEHIAICRAGASRQLHEIEGMLRSSPSLRAAIPELLDEAYEMGRMLAADAVSGLTQFDFPLECCYDAEELCDGDES